MEYVLIINDFQEEWDQPTDFLSTFTTKRLALLALKNWLKNKSWSEDANHSISIFKIPNNMVMEYSEDFKNYVGRDIDLDNIDLEIENS